MGQVINIPKNTILKAVMGTTDYRVSGKKRSFDEPRQKIRYYSTEGRLTRAQILVLLDLHRHLDASGYAYDVKIREISESTSLTMQCVNKTIQALSDKGFIVVGIKEYGYLNYFIDREPSYIKENNSGGYYQMEKTLLQYILTIKTIDELRLVLISLLEDDFSRVRREKAVLPYESIRKVMPSSAHPKARAKIIRKDMGGFYKFTYEGRGLIFTLDDRYYGKYVGQRIKLEADELLTKLRNKEINLSSKDSSDIISLCMEYGTHKVTETLYCMDINLLKESSSLGMHIRQTLKAAS